MSGNGTHSRAAHPYFEGVQALRGLAALLVVLFHLVDAEQIYGKGPMLLDGIARLGFVGVDVFFVISGFVMMTIARNRFGQPAEARIFLMRRAVRILPLYWFYTTAVVALLFIPNAVDASYHAKSVWASFMLWPQETLPLLQVGWTLIYEAFFYLVMATGIAFVPGRYTAAFLAAWAALLALLQAFQPHAPWFAVVSNPMGWEFIAGAFVGMYFNRLPLWCARVALVAGIVGAGMAAAVLSAADMVDQDPLRRTMLFGTCSALVVAGITRRESAGLWRAHPLWRLIGDASYSIYLSHLFVVTLAARLWGRSGFNGSLATHALFIAAAILLSVAVGIASYTLLEKPIVTRLGRFVTNRRAGRDLAQSAL